MNQIIRMLRQKIELTHDQVQKLELEKERVLGYCDGLREILHHIESRDLQYDEVDSEIAREALAEIKADPDKVLRGPTLDAYLNRINEVESEAIEFIEKLVSALSKSEHSGIHRQQLWVGQANIYEVAREIISRAKGAHDDRKPDSTDGPGSHNRVNPGT